jgi:hypothetical protein
LKWKIVNKVNRIRIEENERSEEWRKPKGCPTVAKRRGKVRAVFSKM